MYEFGTYLFLRRVGAVFSEESALYFPDTGSNYEEEHEKLDEDLRLKTWVPTIEYQSNAVVLARMDVIHSMGEFEKEFGRDSSKE